MPDASGRFRGIAVPEDAWTRIFGPALADDPAYDVSDAEYAEYADAAMDKLLPPAGLFDGDTCPNCSVELCCAAALIGDCPRVPSESSSED